MIKKIETKDNGHNQKSLLLHVWNSIILIVVVLSYSCLIYFCLVTFIIVPTNAKCVVNGQLVKKPFVVSEGSHIAPLFSTNTEYRFPLHAKKNFDVFFPDKQMTVVTLTIKIDINDNEELLKQHMIFGGPDNLKAAVLNQYRSEFISIIDSIGPTNFHMVLVKGKEIDEKINNFQSSFTNLQIYPSVYVYARDKRNE